MNDSTKTYTQEQIEDWLVQRFSQISAVTAAEIDIDRPFIDYQLDSAVAVTVSNELSSWLGYKLPITLFWEYPSISSLSCALGAGDPAHLF